MSRDAQLLEPPKTAAPGGGDEEAGGAAAPRSLLDPTDTFPRRHLGSGPDDLAAMLATVGVASLDELVDLAIPRDIRMDRPLALPAVAGLPADRPPTERELLARLRQMAAQNQRFRSFIGMGYHGCVTPAVIQRNILENPGWYTQYTPYQSEISQGRLEALLNFQTLIEDLTALPVANSSLLDEATAAAEAMSLCLALAKKEKAGGAFFVADHCHPQTVAVVETRAGALDVEVRVGDPATADLSDCFGVLVQYPTSDGRVLDLEPILERAHQADARTVVAADLLALVLLRPPGEMGADVAVGSAQRFGVPLGYGGPHAAYLATREEYKRQIPGRIIGVSKDSQGNTAYRMALQTREQHIRREKATSNICTAQVLLAIMAGMYAVYHGPEGLRQIARRVHALTATLAAGLRRLGFRLADEPFFDTLRVELGDRPAAEVLAAAEARGVNLRPLGESAVGLSLDEATTRDEVAHLLDLFAGFAAGGAGAVGDLDALLAAADLAIPAPHARSSDFLAHPVFHRFHTEHEMLRYIKRLESRDLSLTHSMIPLGSCTMKLNATTEMAPISWSEWTDMHPFAPPRQAAGYAELFATLEAWLNEITGFAATSLMPNAGSQGEYTGLMVIRAYHRDRGERRPRRLPDPGVGPRHQPGVGGDGGVEGGHRRLRRQGRHRPRRPGGQGRAARRAAGGADGHLPVDPRRLRAAHPRDVRRHPPPRRPGLSRRRQHERPGRAVPAGRLRRRRLPPQPAQDLLHPARRRRSGHGTDLRRRAPGALPADPPGGGGGRRQGDRAGGGGAVGQRLDPHHPLGLHRHDGQSRAHRGQQAGDPQRQLHGQPPGGALRGALHRRDRPRGARVHPRPAPVQGRPASRRSTSPSG